MTPHLVFHPRFLDHRQADAGHPERPERLQGIVRRLQAEKLWTQVHEPQPASREALARAHDEKYLEKLRNFGEGRWDFDTSVRPETCEIAALSAGAAMLAAELAWNKKQPAIALVRPPGHHATRETAMGFCYYNNIAVAALEHLHAGRGRVAIVDLDVHHGNGTQDIFYNRADALFISLHQQGIYPGTGSVSEIGAGPGMGFTANIPLPRGSGDATYALAFERIVEPLLGAYEPSLLLVSLGADAHMMDPLAGMTLSTTGYLGILDRLKRAAARLCEGRLAIALEGGYHLESLAEVVAGTVALLNDRRLSHPVVYSVSEDASASGSPAVRSALTRLSPHWPMLTSPGKS